MKIQINSQKSFWIVWRYETLFSEYPEVGRSVRTICSITDDSIQGSPYVVATGSAMCSSNDQFVKETGRKISLDRAIRQLKLPKIERTIVWNTYLKRKNS